QLPRNLVDIGESVRVTNGAAFAQPVYGRQQDLGDAAEVVGDQRLVEVTVAGDGPSARPPGSGPRAARPRGERTGRPGGRTLGPSAGRGSDVPGIVRALLVGIPVASA